MCTTHFLTVMGDCAVCLNGDKRVFFFCLNSLDCCKMVCLCLCCEWGIVSPVAAEMLEGTAGRQGHVLRDECVPQQ